MISVRSYYEHAAQRELEKKMSPAELGKIESRVRGETKKNEQNAPHIRSPTPDLHQNNLVEFQNPVHDTGHNYDHDDNRSAETSGNNADVLQNHLGTPDSSSSSESDESSGSETSDEDAYGEDTPAMNKFTQEELDNIHDMLEFIKNYDFDEEKVQWTEDQWNQFMNPPEEPLDLDSDPDLRFSIEIYLALSHSSEATYARVRNAYQKRHPNGNLLSYDQVRRRLQNITGIFPLRTDRCPNNCIAYFGPYSHLESCPKCGEERFDKNRRPRSQYTTLPLGPQLQALWRHPEMAAKVRSRLQRTEEVLKQRNSEDGIQDFSDIIHGTDYLDLVDKGKITEDTMVFFYSEDAAQLYRDKESSTLFGIGVSGDLESDVRHLEDVIMPLFVVGGPKAPQVHDSFVLLTLAHIAACQRRGIRVYDSLLKKLVKKYPWLLFALADTVAMAEMSKSVGHHGRNGCRLLCNMPGRHKPGVGTYYPALLRPNGAIPQVPVASAHEDIDVNKVNIPTVEEYRGRLDYVLQSTTITGYKRRRRETGVRGPSLFSALPKALPVPKCFPADAMHQFYNVCQLLLQLWRGSIDYTGPDSPADWDFAILHDPDRFAAFGTAVERAGRYIPTCIETRIPRNTAEKINSGYKVTEYLTLVFGLCPAFFYGRMPSHLYKHFCKLVSATRIVHRRQKSKEDLRDAHQKFAEFVVLFEHYYYNRQMDRLHFVRPCIHSLLHVVPEHFRVGSITELSQWTMERTIGNYERRIRLHSDPYGNLSQEIIEQAMSNALCAMDPSFRASAPNPNPNLCLDVGSGYSLLHPRDMHLMEPEAHTAFNSFCKLYQFKLDDRQDTNSINVNRFARLRLPNDQIARSLWQEKKRDFDKVRSARNVKLNVGGEVRYAEVLYFFYMMKRSVRYTLAAVKLFSMPDPEKLKNSDGELKVCMQADEDDITIVDVKWIVEVVGMIPYPCPEEYWDWNWNDTEVTEYFVMEKLCSCTVVNDDEDEE